MFSRLRGESPGGEALLPDCIVHAFPTVPFSREFSLESLSAASIDGGDFNEHNRDNGCDKVRAEENYRGIQRRFGS